MNEITKLLLDALKGAVAQMNFAAECVERGRHDEAILHLRSLTRGRSEIIAKAEAALAEHMADEDRWIPWSGGECPINNGVWFWLRFRNGHQFGPDNEATLWRWDNNHLNEGDIIAYRIAKGADK